MNKSPDQKKPKSSLEGVEPENQNPGMASAEGGGSKPLPAPPALHYGPVGDSTPLLRFRRLVLDRKVPFRPISTDQIPLFPS